MARKNRTTSEQLNIYENRRNYLLEIEKEIEKELEETNEILDNEKYLELNEELADIRWELRIVNKSVKSCKKQLQLNK